MKPEIAYVYNKLKQLRFEFKESDRKLFPNEYTFDYGLDRYVRVDGNDLYISKDTFKPLEEELEYADKCHNLEQELGCPLDMYVSIKENGIFIEEEYDEEEHTGLTRLVNIPPRDLCLDFKKDEITIYWEYTLDIYMELKFSDYKKTWWLKEDKSE